MATARENKGAQMTVAVFSGYYQTETRRGVVDEEEDGILLTTEISSSSHATADLWNMSLEGEEETPSPPMSPQPLRGERNVQEFFHRLTCCNEDHLSEQEIDYAKEVARRLIQMGDEMEITLQQHNLVSELLSAISTSDQVCLQQHFRECFQRVREQFTAKTIVKVFYLGYRLLTCTTKDSYEPEQTEVVESVIVFLIEQVTSLIQEQGGWTEILTASHEQEDEEVTVFSSRSTPTLLQHTARAASTPPDHRRSSTDLVRNWRSQSFSYAIPIRRGFMSSYPPHTSGSFPRTLSHDTNNSSTSNSRHGSLSSLITIVGAGALTVALVSYLQS